MDLIDLNNDLIPQGMKAIFEPKNPGLRYKRGIFWFLTEYDCSNDIIIVELQSESISVLRMAEGIVKRHFPLYTLNHVYCDVYAVFTRV